MPVELPDFQQPLPRPCVMGILNATPDSFHAGSRVAGEAALAMADTMVQDGVDVLDLGGQSSRPGVKGRPLNGNARTILHGLLERFPDTPVSIDIFTRMRATRPTGHASMTFPPARLTWTCPCRGRGVYIAMHMQGTPETMQDRPTYGDVV